jgi:hypothetical protein
MTPFDTTRYQVVDFAYFTADDRASMMFAHELSWSRVYEYPYVLERIRPHHRVIHNACWGFRDIHVVFKTHLDMRTDDTWHTDLRPSTLHNTSTWDIREAPPQDWVGFFDVVVNVSTLEEVAVDHRLLLEHHLVQLAPGGRFICTFDIPGLQLGPVEEWLGQPIGDPPNRLTPRTSALPDQVLRLPPTYTVGHLCIDRIDDQL